MSLDDFELPFGLNSVLGSACHGRHGFACSGFQTKTVRKFAELYIYCHRQKYGPGTLVSGNIIFMWLFRGVP